MQTLPVGRLFWKFFIFIWLVQMAGMAGVGTIFWLRHRSDEQVLARYEAPRQLEKPNQRLAVPPPPRQRRFPIVPLVATLLASLICAALLARYFSRPIRDLRRAFDAAAAGQLDQHLGATMGRRNDELADLGHDFDRMTAQLKSLMDAQRRLLHDVSHELRSPMARLHAAIGLARQQPERLEATLDRIELESGRMDHLVSELLTLSRLEAGVSNLRDEAIPMAALLNDIVEDARFEAEARLQEVQFDSTCDMTLQGRADLLHRAIENVVRNALKHTPNGKRITIQCAHAGPSLRIAILDQGPGVPEDELARIFTPFYRGSGAYSTDGYGLGLAIAQRIIQAHDGIIHVSNRDTGGLCVEIILPVTPLAA